MRKTFAFLLFMFVILSFNVYGQEQSADKIVVYYFHGDFRCPTCMIIEQQTKESIFQNYKDEIDSGRIEVEVVNYDKKENKHFIKDYGLYTKAVVLSLVQNGQETRFDNLQEVWQLVWNKEKFGEYIKNQTQKYLDILTTEEKEK